MGEIVAAIFTTHVPRLMIHDPEARRAYMGKNVTTFYDAMEPLERERLRALEFDTFVLIDTHWFTTLEYVLNAQERLRGLYTSEELPQMIHEYAYDYPGDPELAAAIVEAARSGGLRAIASGYPTLPLHYPTLNVMHYFNPGATRRVLSMGVCQTARISNDVAFGVAMGAAIRASDRRVVLIAAGGMSHRFWDYDNVLQHASASPDDISSLANRLYDEKLMEWFSVGTPRRDSARRPRVSRRMFARGTLLALPDDGGRDGRRGVELARRAVRTLRSRARNRPGNFLFRPAHRRGASGRAGAGGRSELK